MVSVQKLVNIGVDVASQIRKKSGDVVETVKNPIEKSANKLTNSLSCLASNNSALVKKTSAPQLIDETVELFSGCVKKPLNQDLSNLSSNNMVLVHMTDFEPENGKILCARSFGETVDGLSKPRKSVHFTVNNISPELLGDPCWADKKIGIILPADKLLQQADKTKLLGGLPDDFMLSDDVKIPKGSFIVKHNADIPKGKLKISDSVDGVKLIETSNENMNEVMPQILNKAGFSTIQTESYNSEKMKNWKKFIDEQGLMLEAHQTSPWGRAESLIDTIFTLGVQEDSWHYAVDSNIVEAMKEYDLPASFFIQKGENQFFDYKQCFFALIEQIKKDCPKEKLPYDVDKLAEIIRGADKPTTAMSKIKSDLQLTSMKSEDILKEAMLDFKLAQTIDTYIVTSTEKGKKLYKNTLCLE